MYDFKGSKKIEVRRTNGNKLTFTAILAMTMDGTKLPPIFIYKSQTSVPQSLKNQALLYTNTNGWCLSRMDSKGLAQLKLEGEPEKPACSRPILRA